MEKVRVEVEDERDIHLENIFYTLPRESQNIINKFSPLTRLKQAVPVLDMMDEFDSNEICDSFKGKRYTNDEIIIEVGNPLEMMLLILDGFVAPENGSGDLQQYGEGESYGEIVVYWLLQGYFRGTEGVILATESVRAIGDVETLVLMARDIKSVLSTFMLHFRGDYHKLKEELDNHLAHARTLETFAQEEYLRFDEAEEIARGAHSTMYKVVISKDSGVLTHAVKRYRDGFDRLHTEVAVLSVINHKNVVKLLGQLERTDDEAALVFEYAGPRYYERKLSFRERLYVAEDIASALVYLHSSTDKPLVIHQNVNLEHVLLDGSDEVYTAKLSGFGSSQLIPECQTRIHIEDSQMVQAGDDMIGYLDPEFIDSKILSERVDVYSFGGVLLELLTGQKPYSSTKLEALRILAALKSNGYAEVVDNSADRQEIISMAGLMADLALNCLSDKGKDRPSMERVLRFLRGRQLCRYRFSYCDRKMRKVEKRIVEKSGEVDEWLTQRGIPKGSNTETKNHIMWK